MHSNLHEPAPGSASTVVWPPPTCRIVPSHTWYSSPGDRWVPRFCGCSFSWRRERCPLFHFPHLDFLSSPRFRRFFLSSLATVSVARHGHVDDSSRDRQRINRGSETSAVQVRDRWH